MQRPLEEALDHADDVIESIQRQPPRGRPSSSGEKSLHEKLYDIYLEECAKESAVPELRSNVNLLEKLVRRESLPCLVINLYPENQDYSLMLKDNNGTLSKAFKVPYSKEKLIEYVDAKSLPPVLLDILEKSPVNVFQHGCVIAEIRDYRQCGSVEDAGYQSQHILLRPTMETLVCDVESMTKGDSQCTQEEKLERESQLILATAEPLCPKPSVAVSCMSNRVLSNKQKMVTDPMRQCFMKHEWPFLDVKKQSTCTTPPGVTAMISCKKEAERKADCLYDLTTPEAGMWKQRPCELTVPSEVNEQQYNKGNLSVSCDDREPTVLATPEVKYHCVLECEEGSHPWEPMPSIMQSLSDPLFSTEIVPPVEGRCDSQMFLPTISPGDCVEGSMAGAKTRSLQSKAECPGTMPQESSGLFSLGQPSPVMMATSLGSSSVLGKAGKMFAPPVTLPSSMRQGSSAISRRTRQVSRPRKLPRLAPAPPKPASQVQAFVGVSMIGTLLSAAQPSGNSVENNPANQGPCSFTDSNVFNVLGLPPGAPVLVNDSSQVLGCSACDPAHSGILPSNVILPKGKPPQAQTRAAQPPVHNSLQLIVNNTSSPISVTLPPGAFLLRSRPQPQSEQSQNPPQPPLQVHLQLQETTPSQLQVTHLHMHRQPQSEPPQQAQSQLKQGQPQQAQSHLQLLQQPPQQQSQSQLQQGQQPLQQQPEQTQPLPQQLYVLISNQQAQTTGATLPSQPVPPALSQGSSSQQWALLQQTSPLNLAGAREVQQSRAAVLCQVGSTQQSLGQNFPQQSFQLSAAPAQLPRAHNVQRRLLPRTESVATQDCRHEPTISHLKRRGRRGTSTTRKS